MQCPICGGVMTSSRCCGEWIAEARLVDMAQEMRGSLVELPWKPRKGTPRNCPSCSAPMQTVTLAKVDLDRCPAHGVWFDKDELQKVLQGATKFPEPAVGDVPNVRMSVMEQLTEDRHDRADLSVGAVGIVAGLVGLAVLDDDDD